MHSSLSGWNSVLFGPNPGLSTGAHRHNGQEEDNNRQDTSDCIGIQNLHIAPLKQELEFQTNQKYVIHSCSCCEHEWSEACWGRNSEWA